MLTKEQQEELRAELDRQARRLMRSLGVCEEELRNGNGDLRVHTDHPADRGSDAYSQSEYVRERRRLANRLRRIVKAQERLDDHPQQFDVCVDCFKTIPFGRLEFEPTTRRCCSCKKEKEQWP